MGRRRGREVSGAWADGWKGRAGFVRGTTSGGALLLAQGRAIVGEEEGRTARVEKKRPVREVSRMVVERG